MMPAADSTSTGPAGQVGFHRAPFWRRTSLATSVADALQHLVDGCRGALRPFWRLARAFRSAWIHVPAAAPAPGQASTGTRPAARASRPPAPMISSAPRPTSQAGSRNVELPEQGVLDGLQQQGESTTPAGRLEPPARDASAASGSGAASGLNALAAPGRRRGLMCSISAAAPALEPALGYVLTLPSQMPSPSGRLGS